MKKVSDAEEIIMSVIWSNEEPMALDEIRTKANAACGKDWKPQTVSTFLTRLCKKGFISSVRTAPEGQNWLYRNMRLTSRKPHWYSEDV